jgi:hypothetical protein
MKKLILSLFLTFTGMVNSQTVIEFDNMETSSPTYLSAGWLLPAPTAGWFTDASFSPTVAAAIYGNGKGDSGLEQGWYSLPMISGLDPNKQYKLKFRVASYSFSAPTAGTRGLDVADYLSVQVSSNGGAYVNEMRITGNTNATWPFTNTGAIEHITNGSFTNSLAPAGDIYMANAGASTATASTYTLSFPQGLTSIAVDFYCRINSSGEEWWLDNIELIVIDALPVEMMSFEGITTEKGNLLTWKTATEYNSDYYWIERTTTGEFNENSVIGQEPAAGNSTVITSYSFLDNDFEPAINYYRLVQVDIDGQYKIYGPIMVNNTLKQKTVVKTINLMGQEFTPNSQHGIYIEIYDDGTMKKVYKN